MKVQVLICKCGAEYAACKYPEWSNDIQWIKDREENRENGGTDKVIDADEFEFSLCTCDE